MDGADGGHGARVIIWEVDLLRALEAVMDGFEVMPIAKAAPIGDFFCYGHELCKPGLIHGVSLQGRRAGGG